MPSGAPTPTSMTTPRLRALANRISTTAPLPTSSGTSYVKGRASARALTSGKTEASRDTGGERSPGPGRSLRRALWVLGTDGHRDGAALAAREGGHAAA